MKCPIHVICCKKIFINRQTIIPCISSAINNFRVRKKYFKYSQPSKILRNGLNLSILNSLLVKLRIITKENKKKQAIKKNDLDTQNCPF